MPLWLAGLGLHGSGPPIVRRNTPLGMWTGGQSERRVTFGSSRTSLERPQVFHWQGHTPSVRISGRFPRGLFPQLSTMIGLHNMYYTHLLVRKTTTIVPFMSLWCRYTDHSPTGPPPGKKGRPDRISIGPQFLLNDRTGNQGCLPAISPNRTCASCWTCVPSSCASDSQMGLASAAFPAAIRLRACAAWKVCFSVSKREAAAALP